MRSLAIAAVFAVAMTAPANAGQSVNLVLNWMPAADHSPFYYAKALGWYEKAGIDLTIEVGKGSGVSSLKVGSGGAPFGIAYHDGDQGYGVLAPERLAALLDELGIKKRVLILSACYSGVFIPVLANENTAMFTAASSDRTSARRSAVSTRASRRSPA